MILSVTGHGLSYEIQSVCQLFFPGIEFGTEDGYTLSSVYDETSRKAVCVFTTVKGVFRDERVGAGDDLREPIKRSVYEALRAATGLSSPWGILTGIRPAQYYDKMTSLLGPAADALFTDTLCVAPEKLALSKKVCETRRPTVEKLAPDSVSLYVSVPFCPSRCSYCSFVSSSTEKEGKYVEPYLDVLVEEIRDKGAWLKAHGKRVSCIYVGGGTPGVLTPGQTDRMLSALQASVDLSALEEFTYEAGRPDVITPEKLDVLLAHGVGRVSVNTQTLNDDVLAAVGRRHTAAQFYRAYEEAIRRGFCVNVDMIAGLPTETEESFFETVDKLCALGPDNLTLHSLYIKRAADLKMKADAELKKISDRNGNMVRYCEKACENSGYLPYYLYRQKSTVGNHENVGYAKPGTICAYNIYMMDDLQTVIGLGANAVTKFVPSAGNPVRVSNTKFAYNYITDRELDKIKFERAADAFFGADG